MRVHEVGQLAAIGNDKGNVCLIEFSENLAVTNKNDKTLLTHVSRHPFWTCMAFPPYSLPRESRLGGRQIVIQPV